MRDGASVNNVAMQVVNIVYPDALDNQCFSHTLDLIGNKYQFSLIFGRYGCLFSHSPKTKMLWKEQTGRAMPTYRWWSRWEVLHHICISLEILNLS